MTVDGLEFPDDLHYLVEEQVWARREGDSAVVGITALGVQLSGELYMCRPKVSGSRVEQGKSIAVAELAKSIVSVRSPVTGTVVEINAHLATEPQRVHQDPYGSGWLARVRLSAWDGDRARLLHGAAVAPAMAHHAWLYRRGEGDAGTAHEGGT